MISGFSPAHIEFQSNRLRVGPEADKCQGCYAVYEKGFDNRELDCCPRMRGTARRFECTSSITPEQVIQAIQTLL